MQLPASLPLLTASLLLPISSLCSPPGYAPYYHNSAAALVAATSIQIMLVQACAFFAPPSSRWCLLPSPLVRGLRSYSDTWYREADMIVGQTIGVVLIAMCVLPLEFAHSRLLFNKAYAASLEKLQRQRALLLLISGAAISPTDLHAVSRFTMMLAKAMANTLLQFFGWLLSLFALQESVTAILRQLFCCVSSAPPDAELVTLSLAASFKPTLAHLRASRPSELTSSGPLTNAFLSKLAGPARELRELDVLEVGADEVSTSRLEHEQHMANASMLGTDTQQRMDGEAAAANALSTAQEQQEQQGRSSVDAPTVGRRQSTTRRESTSRARGITRRYTVHVQREMKDVNALLTRLDEQAEMEFAEESNGSILQGGMSALTPMLDTGFELPSSMARNVDVGALHAPPDETEPLSASGDLCVNEKRKSFIMPRRSQCYGPIASSVQVEDGGGGGSGVPRKHRAASITSRIVSHTAQMFRSESSRFDPLEDIPELPKAEAPASQPKPSPDSDVEEARRVRGEVDEESEESVEVEAIEDPPPSAEALEEQFQRGGRVIPQEMRHQTRVSRGKRQEELRRIVGAIACDFADVFGFQMTQPEDHAPNASSSGTGGRGVKLALSSVANQIENLVCLMANRMDALEHENKPFLSALRDTIAALHAKVFSPYEKWVQRLRLLPKHASETSSPPITMDGLTWLPLADYSITPSDFACLEEGYAWIHNAQLQRLILFSLIHGEAANLRHLPECLFFIFYSMASVLMLIDTRNNYKPTGIDFAEVQMYHKRLRQGGDEAVGPEDYLNSIVTPIYSFLEHEISQRALESIETRVMYDDVNENFWQRATIDLLLPRTELGSAELSEAEVARQAYMNLRKVLADPGTAARQLVDAGILPKSAWPVARGRHPLSSFFGKTYLERPGWVHCYHVFGRVLAWHAVAFHALLAITFAWRERDGFAWHDINIVCITHAAGKILRQLIDLYIGHPPRSVDSKAFGIHKAGHSRLESFLLIALFSLVPITYVVERWTRREGVTLLYDIMVKHAPLPVFYAVVRLAPSYY